MKILLISDTHGRVNAVNQVVAETGADACFHMGDLCVYTKESVRRFSTDMLMKQVKHAPRIPSRILSEIGSLDTESLRALALEYRTYGGFEDYLSGEKRFAVPVYAIPGNNEDSELLSRVRRQPPENLTFLDECSLLEMAGFTICGLGGDVSDKDHNDSGCSFTSTAEQVAILRDNVLKKSDPEKPLILLTHVPPYDNTILAQLVRDLNPVLALCGHTHHWDERVFDSGCRMLTLPTNVRGYAVLELCNGRWTYQTYRTGDNP